MHLLKENESRGVSPAVYTTPASAFNTLAVDFEKNTNTNTSTSSSSSSNLQMSACNTPPIYGVARKQPKQSISASPPASSTPQSSPVAKQRPSNSEGEVSSTNSLERNISSGVIAQVFAGMTSQNDALFNMIGCHILCNDCCVFL